MLNTSNTNRLQEDKNLRYILYSSVETVDTGSQTLGTWVYMRMNTLPRTPTPWHSNFSIFRGYWRTTWMTYCWVQSTSAQLRLCCATALPLYHSPPLKCFLGCAASKELIVSSGTHRTLVFTFLICICDLWFRILGSLNKWWDTELWMYIYIYVCVFL